MKKSTFLLSGILASSLLLSPTALAQVSEPSILTEKEQANISVHELPQPVKDSLEKLYLYKPELKGIPIEIKLTESPTSSKDRYFLRFKKDQTIAAAIIGQDGNLHNFNIHNPDEKSEHRPSDEAATKKATEFLNLVYGNDDDYVLSHVGNGGYTSVDKDGKKTVTAYASVTFLLLVNGIPYDRSSSVQIDVNQEGEVVNWFNHGDTVDKKAFPVIKEVISKEAAEKAFLQSLTMNLFYEDEETIRGTTDPKNVRTVLKYMPEIKYIDAVSGKPAEETARTQQTAIKSTTGQGKTLRVSTPKEAAALLKSELGIQVDGLVFREDGDGIEQAKLYEWTTKEGIVYAVQTTDKGDVMQFGSLSVHDPEKIKGEEKIAREEAAAKALAVIKKYLPAHVKEVQVDYTEKESYPDWVDKNSIPKNNILLVSIAELNDNIPIMTRSSHVWVNLGTGAIEQVSLRPSIDSALPNASKRISPEQAAKLYLDSHPLQLQYIWPKFLDQKAEKPILVYAPQSKYFIEYVDGLTGNIVRPYEQ